MTRGVSVAVLLISFSHRFCKSNLVCFYRFWLKKCLESYISAFNSYVRLLPAATVRLRDESLIPTTNLRVGEWWFALGDCSSLNIHCLFFNNYWWLFSMCLHLPDFCWIFNCSYQWKITWMRNLERININWPCNAVLYHVADIENGGGWRRFLSLDSDVWDEWSTLDKLLEMS